MGTHRGCLRLLQCQPQSVGDGLSGRPFPWFPAGVKNDPLFSRLHVWIRGNRAPLALGVRVTVSALVALVAAQIVGLPLPLWAVLTAVIVSQLSVGLSPKASFDYLVGTLAGAAYGGAIAVAIPHTSEATLLGVLFVAVAPLALFAAFRPNRNVLPITAIIVLLVPATGSDNPFDAAILRVLEVVIGAVSGLVVSFLVLPVSAQRQVRQEAERTLDLLADALGKGLAGVTRGLDRDELSHMHDRIGVPLDQLHRVGIEAGHERLARLSSAPDSAPLERTLFRLRTDLLMIGRAATQPLPAALAARLGPVLADVAGAVSGYLRGCGKALVAARPPPAAGPLHLKLEASAAEFSAIRSGRLANDLSDREAEHYYAIGFALTQMGEHLSDLEREVTGWADTGGNAPAR